MASNERLYRSIRDHWLPATLVATLLGTALGVVFIGAPGPAPGSVRAWLFSLGISVVAWSAILALLGGAMDGLGAVRTRFLGRASEIVLPFYVLHQTVILTVGFVVVHWPAPDVAKWAIIAATSLAATLAACELIRRVGPLRVLFGMRA